MFILLVTDTVKSNHFAWHYFWWISWVSEIKKN